MCSFGSCQTRFELFSQFRKVRNAFECFVTQVETHLPKTKRVWPMKINVICTVADTGERQIRLVGSFPEARLVLGEVAENPLCPARISGADVRHGCSSRTVPPVRIPAVCRPTDG